jgi:hypothetical protein
VTKTGKQAGNSAAVVGSWVTFVGSFVLRGDFKLTSGEPHLTLILNTLQFDVPKNM